MTDVGVCAVITGCPLLESIDVECFDGFDLPSTLLNAAFVHGHRLTCIRMLSTELCNGALLGRPASSAPLRKLACCWGVASRDAVRIERTALSSLTELELGGIHSSYAVTLRAALRAMPQLHVFVYNPPEDQLIDPVVLRAVAHECRQLTTLDINMQCSYGAEPAFMDIARNNPSLVKFYTMTDTTDTLALALATHCTNLKHVQLFGDGAQLTDISIIALAHRCSKLETLLWHGEWQVTEASILTIAAHCHDLQSLNLRYKTDIQGSVYVHLVRSCRKLRYLCAPAQSLPRDIMDQLKAIHPTLDMNTNG